MDAIQDSRLVQFMTKYIPLRASSTLPGRTTVLLWMAFNGAIRTLSLKTDDPIQPLWKSFQKCYCNLTSNITGAYPLRKKKNLQRSSLPALPMMDDRKACIMCSARLEPSAIYTLQYSEARTPLNDEISPRGSVHAPYF